ncbi:hypothetical protein CCICO_00630 [Corynebacterium ciconiae DSM 44920]|nr:hypothetical protein CCICO_00630 [Corynebacterium ciconiae DSM 44920]
MWVGRWLLVGEIPHGDSGLTGPALVINTIPTGYIQVG